MPSTRKSLGTAIQLPKKIVVPYDFVPVPASLAFPPKKSGKKLLSLRHLDAFGENELCRVLKGRGVTGELQGFLGKIRKDEGNQSPPPFPLRIRSHLDMNLGCHGTPKFRS